MPELKAGEAQVNVTAVRPVLFGLRQAAATATRTLEVRLTPPQLAVLSQFHYINHGGSEMVVYRVTPPDVESGVRVGDQEYRGFPAGGTDPAHARRVLRTALGSGRSTRRSRSSRATPSATKAAAASTSACFRSSFARARSASTTGSSRASCRRSCRTRRSSRSTTRATSWPRISRSIASCGA